MNPYTNKLYVIGRSRDEQVNEDGTVEGGNKKYKMSFQGLRQVPHDRSGVRSRMNPENARI